MFSTINTAHMTWPGHLKSDDIFWVAGVQIWRLKKDESTKARHVLMSRYFRLLSWSQKSNCLIFSDISKTLFVQNTSKMIKDHAMPSRSFVSGSNWRSQLIAMTGANLAKYEEPYSWTCYSFGLRILYSIRIRILLTHCCVFCYFCKFVS